MLGKRSRLGIGMLVGALRSGIVDLATSPRSPLEYKMHSYPPHRGPKNYDQGGVGLGIVVALDKSENGCGGGEVLAKYALCGPISTRSSPIPVNPCSAKTNGLDEEVTYVTCHGPNKSLTTMVYYNDGKCSKTGGNNRIGRKVSVFKISPARLFEDRCSDSNSDFLSSCYLCRKSLHGKDIYMYRGEKAFCSAECRQNQMGIDQRKEQCRSESSRSGEFVSSSSSPTSPLPYTFSPRRGQIFSPGIVAA